jgi:predicted transcriptional regulator
MAEDAFKAPARADLIGLTSQIVAAYVSRNPVAVSELPALLRLVHASLEGLAHDPDGRSDLKPAVPVHLSIEEDHLICLEDGLRFKSLKRHLRARYDLTPEEYREKWNLPPDYPMVAPGYSRTRSKLARASGLGRNEKP